MYLRKMYTYISLVDDHDEVIQLCTYHYVPTYVAMYLPLTDKLVSTNQRAN